MAPEQQRLEEILAGPIEGLGFDLVRVIFRGDGRAVLQIMVERADRAPVTVEDCAQVSRAVSAVLDVADPIPDGYALEVSSPGIDRPLVRPQDFVRFRGFEAKLELREPLAGRKRFRGTLAGLAEDGGVLLCQDGAAVTLPHEAIRTARLVPTDALIRALRDRRI